MAVVMPYARHLISGQPRPFGLASQPVALHPTEAGHRLELRSSQPDTPPLSLVLDDAELADLVRCLDQLLLDPRLAVPFQLEAPRPLRRGELLRRQPLSGRPGCRCGDPAAGGWPAGVAADSAAATCGSSPGGNGAGPLPLTSTPWRAH
jgi:Domain of unknown function (DUF4335)